jgi:PAS domain-containing protein
MDTGSDGASGGGASLESKHRWLLWLVAETTSEIVRADGELMLFGRICGMLVRHGFSFAWVGLLEPSGKRLAAAGAAARDANGRAALGTPQASDEQHRELIDRIRFARPWLAHIEPGGAGPATGSAWADLAGSLGASAVAFLPLGSAAIVHGVLVLGAADPHAFDDASMALLARLAGDCGAGLDRLGRSQGAAVAEVALRDARARFHALYDLAPDAIMLVWPDRVELNETLVRMFAIPDPTALDRSEIPQLFDPEVVPEMVSLFRRRLAGQPAPERYESIGRRSNGQRFPILVRVRPIAIAGDEGFAVYITDLSQ